MTFTNTDRVKKEARYHLEKQVYEHLLEQVYELVNKQFQRRIFIHLISTQTKIKQEIKK